LEGICAHDFLSQFQILWLHQDFVIGHFLSLPNMSSGCGGWPLAFCHLFCHCLRQTLRGTMTMIHVHWPCSAMHKFSSCWLKNDWSMQLIVHSRKEASDKHAMISVLGMETCVPWSSVIIVQVSCGSRCKVRCSDGAFQIYCTCPSLVTPKHFRTECYYWPWWMNGWMIIARLHCRKRVRSPQRIETKQMRGTKDIILLD
jgi:hypothetical protein